MHMSVSHTSTFQADRSSHLKMDTDGLFSLRWLANNAHQVLPLCHCGMGLACALVGYACFQQSLIRARYSESCMQPKHAEWSC